MTANIQNPTKQTDRLGLQFFNSGTNLLGHGGQFEPEWLNSTGIVRMSSTAKNIETKRQNGLTAIDQPPIESITTNNADLMSTWELVWLEKALKEGDTKEFTALWHQIDWAARQPSQIASAIRLAIAAEAPIFARALSVLGTELHPDDTELQTVSRVVAPPIVTTRLESPRSDIRSDRDWVRANRLEYRGKWVALRNGELLAAAETVESLVDEVGDVRNTGILITQIW